MKVTGPGFSMDASGSIGGTLTFSKWKGRNYIRTLVTPANPQSDGQVAQRAMLKFLSQSWRTISALDQQDWFDLAQAGSFSLFNAFVKENLRRWTLFKAPSEVYPVTEAAACGAVSSGVVTPGVRNIAYQFDIAASANNSGTIVYRSSSGSPTGVKSEVRAVLITESAGTYTFNDSPLTTGDTWYYAAQPFSVDGLFGSLGAAANGVVG